MIGTSNCPMHGAKAPQVQQVAQARITLAEALARGDRRSAAEILLDSLHGLDHIARDTKIKVVEGGEPVDPALLDRFIENQKSAAQMAKAVHDLGLSQASLNDEAADLVIGALMITADLLKIPLSERRARKALSLGMKGVDEIGGSDAKARRQYLDRESSRLLALMDESEAAVKPPPAHDIRADYLTELKGVASLGRCRCCGSLPHDRHDGPAAIEAARASTPDFDGYDGPAPPQGPGDVIVATVIDEPPAPRALPRWPNCQSCGRVSDPSHDATCSGGGGFGSLGAWGR